MELENSRLEQNDAQTDADIAYHMGIIQSLKMQKKMDRTLHEKKVQNIDKNAAELQAFVETTFPQEFLSEFGGQVDYLDFGLLHLPREIDQGGDLEPLERPNI